MKITLIGPVPPFKGGIAQFNHMLVENLKQDHSVQVLSWKKMYPSFIIKNQPIDPENNDVIFLLDYAKPWTLYKAARKIKEHGSDIVIVTLITPLTSPIYWLLVKFIKSMARARVIAICHNVLPHERTFVDKPLAKLFFRCVDGAVVHAKEDAENLRALSKIPVASAFLPIFPAPKGEHIPEILKSLKLKKNVILFFGFVRPYKGLKYLLEALPFILRQVNLDLLVVGEFWQDKEEYTNLVERLKIGENVKIIDKYVPDEDMCWYFERTDVVVMPYISGTQSGVIQTAYFFDKAVISTNVGGFGEAVVEGKTGYLVEPMNPEKLGEAVVRFYKEGRKGEFEENVKRHKHNFSWEKYSKMLLSV